MHHAKEYSRAGKAIICHMGMAGVGIEYDGVPTTSRLVAVSDEHLPGRALGYQFHPIAAGAKRAVNAMRHDQAPIRVPWTVLPHAVEHVGVWQIRIRDQLRHQILPFQLAGEGLGVVSDAQGMNGTVEYLHAIE